MPAPRPARWSLAAVLALLAVLAQVALTALPASAAGPTADPRLASLRTLLTQVGTWTGALGASGRLSEPLPLTGSSAGAVVGIGDLVSASTEALLADVTALEDVETRADVALGEDRRGTLTVTRSGDDYALRFATTSVEDQPLSIRSATPKLELSASAGVRVTGTAVLDLTVHVPPTGASWLVRDGSTTPRLTVDVESTLPGSPGLPASFGVLATTVTAAGGTSAETHLVGTVDDPDSDGRLSADPTGELSDPAAAVGLWQVVDGAPGRVDAQLTVSSVSPAVTGTVRLSGTGTGDLVVSTAGFGSVAAFERVAPRDVADMLGQLVTLVGGSQRTAANVELPFLTGTVADAVPASEALKEFLEATVPQPGTTGYDPARAGEPTWRSVQDLLRALNAFTSKSGARIVAEAGALDAQLRLPLDITITRESAAAVPLAPPTVAASGASGRYTARTVSDAQAPFSRELVGRRVVGGTSGGVIESVSADGRTATLRGDGWIPATPVDGQPYSVSGASPDAGTVQLGDLIADGPRQVDAANAMRASAMTSPSYSVHLPVALDLSAPVTGDACTRTPLGGPCPFTRTNADGSKTVVTEHPLAVERLLLKTGGELLRADFPTTAPIELSARLGFLEVAVAGEVALARSDDDEPMHRLSTVQDETAYTRVTTYFRRLVEDPAGLLTATTGVAGTVSKGTVTVPGLADLAQDATFTAEVPDVASRATPTVTTSAGLQRLLALDLDAADDDALRGVVLRTLQQLDRQLSSGDGGTGDLVRPLPLIDTSLRDLLAAETAGGGETVTFAAAPDAATATVLTDATRTGTRAFPATLVGRSVLVGTATGVVTGVLQGGKALRLTGLVGKDLAQPAAGTRYVLGSELGDALALASAAPPETLQDLLALLDARLGGTNSLSVAHGTGSATPTVVLSLDWVRHASRSSGLRVDVAGRTLATTPDERAARVEVASTLALDLDVPLVAQPLAAVPLDVLSTSTVDLGASVAMSGAASASLGPLAVSLGAPATPTAGASVQGHVDVQLVGGGGVDDLAGYLSAASPTVGTTSGSPCSDSTLALCADLPLYVQEPAGWVPLSTSATGTVTVTAPKTAPFTATVTGPSAEELTAEAAGEPLDVSLFRDGLDAYLGVVERSLTQATLDGRLPLVGDDLQVGTDFVGTLRTALDAHLASAAPQTVADVERLLGTGLAEAVTGVGATATGLEVVATCGTAACQDTDPLTAVSAVVVTGDLAQTLAEATLPLDIGVPGLSLRPSSSGADGITAAAGWRLHLALRMDRTDGFSVLTRHAALPEFGLTLGVDLTAELKADLAVLAVTVQDQTTGDDLGSTLQVDLKEDEAETSCWSVSACATRATDTRPQLLLADLQATEPWSDTATLRLDIALHVDWLLKATSASALPGVQAHLQMRWAHAVEDEDASEAEGLTIAFTEVALDAGSFLTEVLGPIVKQLKTVTGPVQPVLDTLYAPVPVLSDLSELAGGPPVTLMTLATTFSTLSGGPKLDFVDRVRNLTALVNGLPQPGSGSLLVPIGSFVVSSAAWDQEATPDAADQLVQKRLYGKKTVDGKEVDVVDESEAQLGRKIDSKSKDQKPVLTRETTVGASAKGAGIAFPLLERPSLVFTLLLGGDVDLVTFDSGELELAFTWRQSYGPVYAPPPVMLTLSGSASITAQLVGGFDTSGLRKAFLKGGGTTDILDGLYFATTDDDGEALAVVTLYGEIAAGAEVSVGLVSVGVEGGISLTIVIAWYDPDGDGKLRLVDFGTALADNPLCLFQMSGRIGLFLRAGITIGRGWFSVSFEFELANLTLLEFSATPDCDPDPPRLGGVTSDGTLVVYAGALGGAAHRGHAAWDNTASSYEEDVVKVVSLHTFKDGVATKSGVRLEMLGVTQEWTGTYTRVLVDGRKYGKPIKVTMIGDGDQTTKSGAVPTGDFDLEAVVLGGDAADVVKTGSGRSVVDGGPGNDTVTVSDRAGTGGSTLLVGGPGNDSLTTGNRAATVAGDGALGGLATTTVALREAGATGFSTPVSVVDWAALTAPADEEAKTDGNDRIALGRGANTAYAGAGDDVVGVAADVPGGAVASANTVVLGNGTDTARGGSGNDTIWTSTATPTVVTGHQDGDGAADSGRRNLVSSGAGNDLVLGSAVEDAVTTSSKPGQKAVVVAGAGDDVLLGGHGQDELYGGPGSDWVSGEPAQVGEKTGADATGLALRTYSKDPLPSGVVPSAKTLVGGDGPDRVLGGNGGAAISGDRVDASCTGSTFDAAGSGAGAGSGADTITGGSGVDVVAAGGGDDRVTGYEGDDLLCGQDGADELAAGAGSDTVWGGPGTDRAYGDSGDDAVFGGVGDDTVYGQAGADLLEGGADADRVSGGTEADVVVGGSRKAGEADAADVLYGDLGDDLLVGDGAVDGYPADLDGPAASGGGDTVYGGAGADRVHGGLGDDVLAGADGDDHLEGGPGTDTVTGDLGEDELVGGSTRAATPGTGFPDAGDVLSGGAGSDLVLGDNGALGAGSATPLQAQRGFLAPHQLSVLDLTGGTGTSGDDTISGGDGGDVLLGQGGTDGITAGSGDDHAEGGAGDDVLTGGDGQDDLLGGSSTAVSGSGDGRTGAADGADTVRGGTGADVVLGDNGEVLRRTPGSPLLAGRSAASRALAVYDLRSAEGTGTSGGDTLLGEEDDDVVLGQGGKDAITAGGGGDYAEGGQGPDSITGDDGQDDLVGGSSTAVSGSGDARLGPVDGADAVEGGPGADVVLGDNGEVLRSSAGSPLTTSRSGTGRAITVHDLRSTDAATSGDDTLRGGEDDDVLFGEGGADSITAGGGGDYAEGGQGPDGITGDDGQDDLVGGSSTPVSGQGSGRTGAQDGADRVSGGAGADVVTGDNADVRLGGLPASPRTALREMTRRAVQLFDLGDAPTGGTSGDDVLSGEGDSDVLLGQGGDDAAAAGGGDDLVEGGPGADTASGGAGQDDLVGGGADLSATDTGQLDDADRLFGGADPDLVVGDNAVVVRTDDATRATALLQRADQAPRSLTLLDRSTGARAGADQLAGGAADDVLLGQSADDVLRGGTGEDWLEGNRGADAVHGDERATEVPTVLGALVGGLDELEGAGGEDGQDDLIGGSSNLPAASSGKHGAAGAPDGADRLVGGGAADFVLGDNGTLFRDRANPLALMPRHAAGTDGTRVRHALRLDGTGTAGTFGGDTVDGGDGDDHVWGQYGNDVINGDGGDDDLIGDLGDDRITGGTGEDAVLGDRGSIVSTRNTASDTTRWTLSSPPKELLVSRPTGALDRRVDLYSDVEANLSPDSGSSTRLAGAAIGAVGGADRIRGGEGHDSLHGGAGDDLVNGDSGGDFVLGGTGSDALWGGKGCDEAVDTPAVSSDCYVAGRFDPAARGTGDRFVDVVLGGRGGLDSTGKGTPEVLDYRPRSTTSTCTDGRTSRAAGTATADPCSWAEMTGDQHRQGTDWLYGGLDRDLMEGDVSANGTNNGDRMIDWNGVYNLYSHCNAAYGGFNDVRVPSPDMQSWLQRLAHAVGAGALPGDVLKPGSSAFDELGLVTSGDTGKGYPTGRGASDPDSCVAN